MTGYLGICGHTELFGAAKLGDEARIDISTRLTNETTISLVCEGGSVPKESVPRLIALHEPGRFQFTNLMKTYAFDDMNIAFGDSADDSTFKPIIVY